MNAFEQRRTDRTVPADASGAYAFTGLRHPKDEPSPQEIIDIVADVTGQPPVITPRPIRTVADLQRSLGLR